MRMFRVLAVSTALMAAMPLMAAAEAPVPQITVTGEAAVQAAPDMAVLSLGVTTQGASAEAAMTANSEALARVIDQLKAAGIAAEDIQTTNLSLSPNWTGYDASGGAQVISGYTATNMVTVRVRALDGLGKVLAAAVGDGANSLNGLSFEMSEPRPAQDAAREAATKDARARAELLAAAAGVKLGRLLSITEGMSGGGMPMPVAYKADAAMAVPVEAGQVSLTSSVTLSFEIVQ